MNMKQRAGDRASAVEGIYANNDWARYLGIEWQANADQSTLHLSYDDRLLNSDGGVVHGGVIATLLHDAAWVVVARQLDESVSIEDLTAVDVDINYIRAARNTDLSATAEVVRLGRQFVFASSQVTDQAGQLVAKGHWVFGFPAGQGEAEFLRQSETPEKLWSGPMELSNIGKMMNQNMAKRVPGLSLRALAPGQCLLQVENDSRLHDGLGGFSAGIQLLATDNVGVFASFGLGQRITRASTVALKYTRCRSVRDENLLVLGQSLNRTGGVVYNRTLVYGEQSLELAGFGTMTFLS